MKTLLICTMLFSKIAMASLACDQVFKKLSADVIPKEARIIHIPQIHYAGPLTAHLKNYNEFERENIIRTQLLIARVIASYPNEIHISEGPNINLHKKHKAIKLEHLNGELQTMSKDFIKKSMDPYFYEKPYNKLTDIEKELIYKHGSALLLLFLDHIDSVYSPEKSKHLAKWYIQELKSIGQKIEEAVRLVNKNYNNHQTKTALKEEINKLIAKRTTITFFLREKLLKEKVKLLSSENPDKRIFFVYGIAHDFTYLFKEDPFYRLPNYLSVTEQYLLHPFWALSLSDSMTNKFITLQETEGLSIENMEEMMKGYQMSYDIINRYIKYEKDDISFFSKQDKHYLTKEAEKIMEFKRYLEHELQSN